MSFNNEDQQLTLQLIRNEAEIAVAAALKQRDIEHEQVLLQERFAAKKALDQKIQEAADLEKRLMEAQADLAQTRISPSVDRPEAEPILIRRAQRRSPAAKAAAKTKGAHRCHRVESLLMRPAEVPVTPPAPAKAGSQRAASRLEGAHTNPEAE